MTNKKQKQLPDISASIGAAPSTPKTKKTVNLVGQTISLDLTKEVFFGVGPIWLSYKNYWCTIPDGMAPSEYGQIIDGLQRGILVFGKKYIPPIEKNQGTLESYWYAIKPNGFNKEATAMFKRLVIQKIDRGYTAVEVAQYCLDNEKAYKKRKDVMKVLNEIIDRSGISLHAWEPPDEEEGIKKVILDGSGNLVKVVLNNGKDAPLHDPGANVSDNSAQAEAALNDVFK